MITKIGIIGVGAISAHCYRDIGAFRFMELASAAEIFSIAKNR